LQLRRENKLTKSSVMVTAGANQVSKIKDFSPAFLYIFLIPVIVYRLVFVDKLNVMFPNSLLSINSTARPKSCLLASSNQLVPY
jgi:hypothetical protein